MQQRIRQEPGQKTSREQNRNKQFNDLKKKFKAGKKKGAASMAVWAMKNYGQIKAWADANKRHEEGGGYNYISFPRKSYADNMPEYGDAFNDTALGPWDQGWAGGIGPYTFGSPREATLDLLRHFSSCANTLCAEDELKKSSHSMLEKGAPKARLLMLGENGDINQYEYSSMRVMASFTGGKAKSGMKLQTKETDDTEILLSFSGGGSSTDFAYTSSEKISDFSYGLEVSMNGEYKSSWEISLDGLLGVALELILGETGVDTSSSSEFMKHFQYDRAFHWNKHGELSVFYTLGDSHFGDKFVVQVASDKRFGTALFTTQGGRSSCPGEPFTIWRESGFTLSLSTTFNEDLSPGERALLRLSVVNESPYRESTSLGLRFVDGISHTVNKIIGAAKDALFVESSTGASVLAAAENEAQKNIGKDSPVVENMIENAKEAIKQNASASSVLAVLIEASKMAPSYGSEMSDVGFAINGKSIAPLSDITSVKFVDSDDLSVQRRVLKTSFTLAVTPLGELTRNIKYILLELQSLCEFELAGSGNFNRDPISHAIPLREMSWSQRCPEAQFDGSTLANYLTTSVSDPSPNRAPLRLAVINPNRAVLWPGSANDEVLPTMNMNLKLVRVQYRPVSGGEWITAKAEDSDERDKKKNLLCGDSRTEGCKFEWDVHNRYEKLLSGFKDGTYEVRVKNFCFGGSAFAHPSVHSFVADETLTLTVDTVAPLEHRRSEDVSARTVTIEYLEQIDCSDQEVALTKVRDDSCVDVHEPVSLEVLKSSFVIKCFNAGGKGHWVMRYPFGASGSYEAVVSSIKDTSGNLASDYAFTFTAGAESTDCASVLCPVNHRVDGSHTCVPCDKGHSRAAGDDSRGDETKCEVCATGYYYDEVLEACASCASSTDYGIGYTSDGGDVRDSPKCDLCEQDYFISAQTAEGSVTCSQCPRGSVSTGRDATSCDPTFCDGAGEYVSDHECLACPRGSLRSIDFTSTAPGDDKTGDDTSCDLCDANFYMSDESTCVACPLGTSKPIGNGDIDTCEATACDEDQYISNLQCVACPHGYSRAAGDRSDGGDTACEKCKGTHYVDESRRCAQCEDGYVSSFFTLSANAAHTRYTSGVTTCDACDVNHAVVRDALTDRFKCQECPEGYAKDSYAALSSGEVRCLTCADGYHVAVDKSTEQLACKPCPIGTVSSPDDAHDVGAGNATSCVPKICAIDEHVSEATCVACPEGYVRTVNGTGDDATAGETTCTVCAENYRVFGTNATGYACVPCEGHGTIAAGGDTTASNVTECAFNACPQNTSVVNHACERCPDGTINAAGDDPLGADTQCTECAENHHADGWGRCVACRAGALRAAGDARLGPPTKCASNVTRFVANPPSTTKSNASAARLGVMKRAPSRADAPTNLGDARRTPTSAATSLAKTFAVFVVFAGVIFYRRRKSAETDARASDETERAPLTRRARRRARATQLRRRRLSARAHRRARKIKQSRLIFPRNFESITTFTSLHRSGARARDASRRRLRRASVVTPRRGQITASDVPRRRRRIRSAHHRVLSRGPAVPSRCVFARAPTPPRAVTSPATRDRSPTTRSRRLTAIRRLSTRRVRVQGDQIRRRHHDRRARERLRVRRDAEEDSGARNAREGEGEARSRRRTRIANALETRSRRRGRDRPRWIPRTRAREED